MRWIQTSGNDKQKEFIDFDKVEIIETDKNKNTVSFIMDNGREHRIEFENEEDFNDWIIFIATQLNMLVKVTNE